MYAFKSILLVGLLKENFSALGDTVPAVFEHWLKIRNKQTCPELNLFL